MMRVPLPALSLLVAATCLAQTTAFEAASIRPSTRAGNDLNELHDGRELIRVSPGLLTIQGASLRICIQWAYGIPPFQIQGPDWLKDAGFDIVAKSASPADENQLRLMLRDLLAQRFGLKTHTENKEMQVYELTVAKGGPKFHESTTEGHPLFSGNGGRLVAERVTMTDLAEKISEPLGRPVIDATGLKGRYDIHLDATAYVAEGGHGPMDVMSLLFNALQQQLGVRLESKKGNPSILVIDNIEKTPTEN